MADIELVPGTRQDVLLDNLVEPPKKPGVFAGAVASGVQQVKSAAGGATMLAGRALGVPSIEARGSEIVQAAAEATPPPPVTAETALDSPGNAVDFVKYAVGSQLPNIALTLAGGLVGRGIGGLLARGSSAGKAAGLAAGLGATAVGMEAGQIFPEAVQTGVENPVGRTTVGALAAGALDTAAPALLARQLGFLGGAGLARAPGLAGRAKAAGAGAALGGAVEGATESAQTYVERLAAGQPLSGRDAESDYLNSGAMGLVLGTLTGGLAGTFAPVQKQPLQVAPVSPSVPATEAPAAPASSATPVLDTAAPPVELGPVNAAFEQSALQPAQPDPLTAARDQHEAIGASVDQLDALIAQHEAYDKRRVEINAQLRANAAEARAPDRARTTRELVIERRALEAERDALPKPAAVRDTLIDAVRRRAQLVPEMNAVARRVADAAVEQPAVQLDAASASSTALPGQPTQEAALAHQAELRDQAEMLHARRQQEDEIVAAGARSVGAAEFRAAPSAMQAALELASQRETERAARDASRAQRAKAREAAAALEAERPRVADLRALQKVNDGVLTAPEEHARLTGSGLAVAGEGGKLKLTSAGHRVAQSLKRAAGTTSTVVKAGIEAQHTATLAAIEAAVATVDAKTSSALNTTPARAARLKQRVLENVTTAVQDAFEVPASAKALPDRPTVLANLARKLTTISGLTKDQAKDIADVVAQAVSRGPLFSHAGVTTEQLHAMEPGVRNEVVDDIDAALTQRGVEMIARLKALIGDDPHLEVRTFVSEGGEGIGSYTRTGPLKSVVSLALNANNTLSLADHEAFHYIEDQLLTAAERQVVARALTRGSRTHALLTARLRRYDAEFGTHLADIVNASPVEARAYAFQFWRMGELQPQGAIATVFAKIQEFLDKVASYIAGKGFTSIEDVFRAIDLGQMAQRERNRESALFVNGVEIPADTFDSVAATQTQSPEFKRWFAGSKVVDAEGNPLVVYHGTSKDRDFAKFNARGNGIWFTPSPQDASSYANENDARNLKLVDGRYVEVNTASRVIPVFLALKNPKIYAAIPDDLRLAVNYQAAQRNHFSRLKAQGFDGVIIGTDPGSRSTVYVAFESAQVKSAIGNRGTFDPNNPNILFSQDAAAPPPALDRQAMQDKIRQIKHGELPREQLFDNVTALQDLAAHRPVDMKTRASSQVRAAAGVFTRARHYVSTQNYIARFSAGYKNVLKALSAQELYKNTLIEDGSKVWLSRWHDASQADRDAAFNALLQRRVAGALEGTPAFLEIRNKLTPVQQGLFDQASGADGMIAKYLWREFAAEAADYKNLMSPDEWQEWHSRREAQVRSLIDNGYVPFDRFGDFTVKLVVDVPGGAPATVGYYQFESEAQAIREAKRLQDEITASGADIRVEGVGARYRAEHDNELSIRQVLDILRRQKIPLDGAALQRLSRALLSADSMRRQRMLQAKLVPGYSHDGWRVLNKFAVGMSGRIAHSTFSSAVNDALDGRVFSVTKATDGSPVPSAIPKSDLWASDGLNAGYYRNLANQRAEIVLSPGDSSVWSTRIKAAAMNYFIGGSLGAGVVQMLSVPMNTLPYLSQHTEYTNAFSTTLTAWRETLASSVALRDLNTLRDPAKPIPAIDRTPGLRAALIEATRDGTVSSTEVHQIMGISRGGLLSKSKGIQKAMDAWLWPFKFGESTSRVASFIAGYRVGRENGLSDVQLYEFARDAVDNTQNRFDPVNRPLMATHPIGSLLFMFKSFPLFMVEMIEGMARSGPQGRKAALFMLLGLTVMTGVQGLPFAEDILDIIDVISQKLFNSPFNARRAMRTVAKDASEAIFGTDLSGLILRGVVNDVVGLNVATRVGNGDVIPGTRLGAADADFARTMEQILGAPFSMVIGAGGQLDNLIGSIAKGDFDGVMSAIRAGGPTAFRNLVKGYEQLDKGFAEDARGNKITDVESPYALMQAIGIAPGVLTKMYDMDSINRAEKAFYTQVRSDFTRHMVKALKAGDSDKLRETYEALQRWNEENLTMPVMLNPASIRREIMLAGMPLNERTQRLLPRQLRGTAIVE